MTERPVGVADFVVIAVRSATPQCARWHRAPSQLPVKDAEPGDVIEFRSRTEILAVLEWEEVGAQAVVADTLQPVPLWRDQPLEGRDVKAVPVGRGSSGLAWHSA